MKIESEKLIQDLIEITQKNINQVEQLNTISIKKLNWKSDSDSWSILECLEHLNLYGDFYIPEIDKKIESSKIPAVENFKSGFLGNYFANSMLPKEKLNKMKTFKDKDPIGSALDSRTIERFLSQQQQLLKLLDKSRKVNLNKTKTAISISTWITLKLGDTFRVVIYHNQRHLVQVNRILKDCNLTD